MSIGTLIENHDWGHDATHRARNMNTHPTHAWAKDFCGIWSAPLARFHFLQIRKRANRPFGQRAWSARRGRPC